MTEPDSDLPEAAPGVFGAALGLIVNPAHVRACGGGRTLTPAPPTTPACVPHTPAPSGYAARHEWAERMSRTHEQQQCPGCGLWLVWTPKEKTDA